MTSAAEESARELSQFFTTRDLAARIVSWAAATPEMRILEPSCGDGAFLLPLSGIGARVVGVEIDPCVADKTRDSGIHVRVGDFLKLGPEDLGGTFDLVVTNPPYEHGADLSHVLHALQFAPRVVALLRMNFLAGMKRQRQLWRNHTLNRLAVFGRRPEFRSPFGHGAKSDYAVFEILRGRLPFSRPVSVEWW